MEDILGELRYKHRKGRRRDQELTVFSLSTCGFCKRALAFLSDNGFAYRFVQLDKIPPEAKRRVKDELHTRFNTSPVFPVLVVDGKRAVTGFTEDQWRKLLKLPEAG